MFFSTDLENLPRVGEYVCLRGSSTHHRPYRVQRRYIDKETGQAYMNLLHEPTGTELRHQKTEPFSFWPDTGDRVFVAPEPYLTFLAERRNKAISDGEISLVRALSERLKSLEYAGQKMEQLCQEHEVVRLGEEGLAAIRRHNTDRQAFWCPLWALVVHLKFDRRTDSRTEQIERAEQLNLLDAA